MWAIDTRVTPRVRPSALWVVSRTTLTSGLGRHRREQLGDPDLEGESADVVDELEGSVQVHAERLKEELPETTVGEQLLWPLRKAPQEAVEPAELAVARDHALQLEPLCTFGERGAD